MNWFAYALDKAFKKYSTSQKVFPSLQRLWSPEYRDWVLPGSYIHCKPDIILLDLASPAAHGIVTNCNIVMQKTTDPIVMWRHIKAVTEVTSQNKFHRTLKNTIDAKSYIMFLTQHDCIFTPVLSFFHDYVLLTITNQESQQHSKIIYINHGRPKELVIFLRIIIGLMFSPDHIGGLDTTMIRNEQQAVDKIVVQGEVFKVIEPLYSVQSLLGHGTKVWHVMSELDQTHYVLKDSWISTGRPSEAETLKALQAMPHIPRFYKGGIIHHHEYTKLNGHPTVLSTSLIWVIVADEDELTSRERRRVVEGLKADPLGSFVDHIEVLVGFRDYVRW